LGEKLGYSYKTEPVNCLPYIVLATGTNTPTYRSELYLFGHTVTWRWDSWNVP